MGEVDVHKVAHHGSSNRDDRLLDLISGQVAIISVGEDNDYGHPAPSLLHALESRGFAVHRTDLEGDVAVVVDASGRLTVGTTLQLTDPGVSAPWRVDPIGVRVHADPPNVVLSIAGGDQEEVPTAASRRESPAAWIPPPSNCGGADPAEVHVLGRVLAPRQAARGDRRGDRRVGLVLDDRRAVLPEAHVQRGASIASARRTPRRSAWPRTCMSAVVIRSAPGDPTAMQSPTSFRAVAGAMLDASRVPGRQRAGRAG